MVSRKSSSRKLSSRKSLSKTDTENIENMIKMNPISQSTIILAGILGIIYNLVLIYYLNNLEGIDCNCIIDWRYYFIKYMSIFGILNGIFLLLNMQTFTRNNTYIYITGILGLVNVYAFFTYIGDLKASLCSCAIEKQEHLTNFYNAVRYLELLIVCFSILIVVLSVIAQLFK